MKICMSYVLRNLFLVLVFSSIACANPQPMPGFPYPQGVDVELVEQILLAGSATELKFKDTAGREWVVTNFNHELFKVYEAAAYNKMDCDVTSLFGEFYKFPVFHIDSKYFIRYDFYVQYEDVSGRFSIQTELTDAEKVLPDVKNMQFSQSFEKIQEFKEEDQAAYNKQVVERKIAIMRQYFVKPKMIDEFDEAMRRITGDQPYSGSGGLFATAGDGAAAAAAGSDAKPAESGGSGED